MWAGFFRKGLGFRIRDSGCRFECLHSDSPSAVNSLAQYPHSRSRRAMTLNSCKEPSSVPGTCDAICPSLTNSKG